MQTRNFLSRVLGGSGSYCMFASRKSDGRLVQKFYSTVDELVDTAKELDDDGYDTYFGLGTFGEGGTRKTTNVLTLNSFFLDIDCGETKDYSTQSEGLVALKEFCKALSLPKPTLVNSGRGIHVYWVLDEAVPRDEWIPVARRLKQACSLHGLLADPAVTSDAARVLRVPFTHNHKDSPPSQVEYIGNGGTPSVDFDSFSNLLGVDLPEPPTKAPPADDKYAHLESHFKDILIKSSKGKGCEQIRLAMTDKEDVSEPIWRGVLSVLKSCEDGSREKAHAISKGYSGYNAYETDTKWDNLQPTMPYSCARFHENKLGVCPDCPYWLKVGSPKTLGNRTKEAVDNIVQAPAVSIPSAPVATYIIPTYPKPYFRGANGGVYLRTTDREGDPIEVNIYHNDLYVVKRVLDVETGESIVMRLHLPKDGVREFTIPLTAVTSKEEFRRQMSEKGVAVAKMEDIMQYTIAWVNELQASGGATMAHKQFGWVGDECKSFVLGGQELFNGKAEFNPPSTQTAVLMSAFEPRGTLDGWKETINFYNRDGFELHQYVVGTGFGSVLMKFMGEISCAALHLHSKESGVGKTTAMLASLSTWGRPDALMLHERDTHASKMNRGEVMHNLPLCMDELTNSSGRQLSDIAYQFTSGKQRMRMSGGSNIERYRGEPWNLLAVSTGNTSIVELISTYKAMPKAEAQRILEIRVKRMFNTPNTKQQTDQFSRDLDANCGWAGIEFLAHIMKDLDAVKALIAKVQERVDREAGLTSENRFWSAQVTATLSGLILAKQYGLIKYNIEPIFKWIIGEVKINKTRVEDMSASVEQTLNDYLNENWGNILWIKSTDDLRSKNTDAESIVIPESMPRGQLVARYETDVKKVYLVLKPLKEWCGKQQLNYGSFIDDLLTKMGAKRDKVRLSKGTLVRLAPSEVIVVNFSVDAEARRP